jgi:hypothetical protein
MNREWVRLIGLGKRCRASRSASQRPRMSPIALQPSERVQLGLSSSGTADTAVSAAAFSRSGRFGPSQSLHQSPRPTMEPRPAWEAINKSTRLVHFCLFDSADLFGRTRLCARSAERGGRSGARYPCFLRTGTFNSLFGRKISLFGRVGKIPRTALNRWAFWDGLSPNRPKNDEFRVFLPVGMELRRA